MCLNMYTTQTACVSTSMQSEALLLQLCRTSKVRQLSFLQGLQNRQSLFKPLVTCLHQPRGFLLGLGVLRRHWLLLLRGSILARAGSFTALLRELLKSRVTACLLSRWFTLIAIPIIARILGTPGTSSSVATLAALKPRPPPSRFLFAMRRFSSLAAASSSLICYELQIFSKLVIHKHGTSRIRVRTTSWAAVMWS